MKFELVGGPHDGHRSSKYPGLEDAETIWASGRTFSAEDLPGFERYDWFRTVDGVDFYIHDCLPEDLIFSTLRKFERPPLTPAEFFEQLRRETPGLER